MTSKKREWVEAILADPDIHERALDGSWVSCRYCRSKKDNKVIRIQSHRNFSYKSWADHLKSLRHRTNAHSGSAPQPPKPRVGTLENLAVGGGTNLCGDIQGSRFGMGDTTKKCTGIYYGPLEYLKLFSIYGNYSDLLITIRCHGNSHWTCHLKKCTDQYVLRPNCKKKCKHACEPCFDSLSDLSSDGTRLLQRVKRMNKIDLVLKALKTPHLEKTHINAITNFTRINKTQCNESKLHLIETCEKFKIDNKKIFKQFAKQSNKPEADSNHHHHHLLTSSHSNAANNFLHDNDDTHHQSLEDQLTDVDNLQENGEKASNDVLMGYHSHHSHLTQTQHQAHQHMENMGLVADMVNSHNMAESHNMVQHLNHSQYHRDSHNIMDDHENVNNISDHII